MRSVYVNNKNHKSDIVGDVVGVPIVVFYSYKGGMRLLKKCTNKYMSTTNIACSDTTYTYKLQIKWRVSKERSLKASKSLFLPKNTHMHRKRKVTIKSLSDKPHDSNAKRKDSTEKQSSCKKRKPVNILHNEPIVQLNRANLYILKDTSTTTTAKIDEKSNELNILPIQENLQVQDIPLPEEHLVVSQDQDITEISSDEGEKPGNYLNYRQSPASITFIQVFNPRREIGTQNSNVENIDQQSSLGNSTSKIDVNHKPVAHHITTGDSNIEDNDAHQYIAQENPNANIEDVEIHDTALENANIDESTIDISHREIAHGNSKKPNVTDPNIKAAHEYIAHKNQNTNEPNIHKSDRHITHGSAEMPILTYQSNGNKPIVNRHDNTNDTNIKDPQQDIARDNSNTNDMNVHISHQYIAHGSPEMPILNFNRHDNTNDTNIMDAHPVIAWNNSNTNAPNPQISHQHIGHRGSPNRPIIKPIPHRYPNAFDHNIMDPHQNIARDYSNTNAPNIHISHQHISHGSPGIPILTDETHHPSSSNQKPTPQPHQQYSNLGVLAVHKEMLHHLNELVLLHELLIKKTTQEEEGCMSPRTDHQGPKHHTSPSNMNVFYEQQQQLGQGHAIFNTNNGNVLDNHNQEAHGRPMVTIHQFPNSRSTLNKPQNESSPRPENVPIAPQPVPQCSEIAINIIQLFQRTLGDLLSKINEQNQKRNKTTVKPAPKRSKTNKKNIPSQNSAQAQPMKDEHVQRQPQAQVPPAQVTLPQATPIQVPPAQATTPCWPNNGGTNYIHLQPTDSRLRTSQYTQLQPQLIHPHQPTNVAMNSYNMALFENPSVNRDSSIRQPQQRWGIQDPPQYQPTRLAQENGFNRNDGTSRNDLSRDPRPQPQPQIQPQIQPQSQIQNLCVRNNPPQLQTNPQPQSPKPNSRSDSCSAPNVEMNPFYANMMITRQHNPNNLLYFGMRQNALASTATITTSNSNPFYRSLPGLGENRSSSSKRI